MKRMVIGAMVLLAGLATAIPLCAAEEKTPTVQVSLRSPKEDVAGKVVKWDEQGLTIQTGKGERELPWSDLTPASAYRARARLIDPKDARQWLELGRMAWGLGDRTDARAALERAAKLDAALKPQANEVLDGEAGTLLKGGTAAHPATREADPKYEKSTPEADKAAIESARVGAAEIGKQLKVKFQEIQTDHFLIFTDWDPREYAFLKENLEAAYAAVSKQFDIPVKENIFIGKLPVFMFNQQADFFRFAKELDGFADISDQVAGYYMHRSDGFGHMAMWKPQIRNGIPKREAEKQWAYVLTHEFTHAFVGRYKSNRHVPTWLNEGIAEVVASGQFPRDEARAMAAVMAKEHPSIEQIFKDGHPSGEWYPVMRTMVETLLLKDRKAFLPFFNDIKDGKEAEQALKDRYKWDYKDLEKFWRRYASQYETGVRRDGS